MDGIFFSCFTWKITHKLALCVILATRFTCIVERSWKNMYFPAPKLAWPPVTCDVISRNHSYWPSLNLSKYLRGGWTNSYWKCQVLMFYPLGKNLWSLLPRFKEGNCFNTSLSISCRSLLLSVFLSFFATFLLLEHHIRRVSNEVRNQDHAKIAMIFNT